MLESIKQKNLSATMLKHFWLISLIYPLCGSSVGSHFSPDVVYANIFVAAFMAYAFLEGNVEWRRKNVLVYVMAFFLLCFNVCALYVNLTYYGWYAGQLNVTIAFLFLMVWLMMKPSASCMNDDTIRFLLRVAVITNVIGLIPGLLGYEYAEVRSYGFFFQPKSADDPSYSWIFHHKSEYAFMLILFLSLTVIYRRLYEKKWQFWGSIAVYTAGLILSNTRTTMLAAMFILAGVMVDYLMRRMGGFRWKLLLWLAPFIAVAAVMLLIFSRERELFTLGARTYIWKGAFEYVIDNPWGFGAMWGLMPFRPSGLWFDIWNCHNVFLNILMQFSIPAGFFYILAMVAAFVVSLWKNRSFTTLGIWAAILIPMNMDWCVHLGETPLMLMILYFLFFHPRRNAE